MKRLAYGVLLWCVCSVTPVAEAGVITEAWDAVVHPVRSVQNAVGYLFAPVNCVGRFGAALLQAHDGSSGELVALGTCVWTNANRNPLTLTKPILP